MICIFEVPSSHIHRDRKFISGYQGLWKRGIPLLLFKWVQSFSSNDDKFWRRRVKMSEQ